MWARDAAMKIGHCAHKCIMGESESYLSALLMIVLCVNCGADGTVAVRQNVPSLLYKLSTSGNADYCFCISHQLPT